jgi:hypothetical protein
MNGVVMKTVVVTKMQYDEILYPAIATQSVGETVAELRMCDAVLNKLEAHGKRDKPLDKSLWAPGAESGPPPLFKLQDITVELEFEDAEADFVIAKLITLLPNTQGRLVRAALPIIDALEAKS